MKISIALFSISLFLFTRTTFSQTGYFTYDDIYDSEGWVIQPANDSNIIIVTGNLSEFVIKKINKEGVELWSYITEVYMHNFYAHALFCVPGDGYYFFTTWAYFHFSEDGELVSEKEYTLADLGYTSGEFEGEAVYFQSVDFNGEVFHALSQQFTPVTSDVDTSYYTITEIGLDGSIIYSRPFYKTYYPELLESRIVYVDGFDYVYYGYNDYDLDHLIHKVDKINAATGELTSADIYDSIELRGILKQADGIIQYGINEYAGSSSELHEFLRKQNNAGETVWDHEFTVDPGYETFIPNLSELIELQSGNLLGLVSYAMPAFTDTAYHALQLFTPNGELLYTTAPFKTTIHSFPWYRSNIHAMTLLDENVIGFAGGDDLNTAFIMLTDTLGNYYHVNIAGQLYNDANGNNVFDSGEIVYPGKLIRSEPFHYYAISDAEGRYNLLIGNNGEYEIYTDSILYWDVIAPSDHYYLAADTSLSGDTLSGYNFRYDYTIPVHDVSVSLYQSGIAPGFASHSSITIKNNGNQYNESGTVILHYPSILEDVSTMPDYFSLDDTTITWNYTSLDPYETQTFDAYYLADTLLYMIGETVFTSSTVYSENIELDTVNNTESVYTTVTASFDPNHKTVSPAGEGAGGNIDDKTEILTYTIEFQNTGTSEAHFINIYDTLNAHLDIESIEMLSASHNYVLHVTAPNILHWQFDSIFLPDSANNLIESMGYLKFRINIKDETSAGDVIENRAAIYFDFNPPVLTNTTKNTLIYITSVEDTSSINHILVYPNPVSNYLIIDFTQSSDEDMNFIIYDLHGNILMHDFITPEINSKIINVSSYMQGMYMMVLYNENRTNGIRFEVVR